MQRQEERMRAEKRKPPVPSFFSRKEFDINQLNSKIEDEQALALQPSPCLSFFIHVLGSLTSLSRFTLITPGVSTLSLQHLTQAADTTLILQIYR